MFRQIHVRREGALQLHHRGFTLVEILVAIFTLTVVLLGLAPMAFNVLHSNNFSKNRTIAVGLARSKIDDLRRTALTTTLSTSITTENNVDENGVEDSGGIFTRVVNITDGAAGQLTTVQVEVSWTDYTDHKVTQTTKIYQE